MTTIQGTLPTSYNPIQNSEKSVMNGVEGGEVKDVAKMATSQMTKIAITGLGLAPGTTAMLHQAIETRMGPGLPGDPQTTEGVADMLSKELGLEPGEVQDSTTSIESLLAELTLKLIGDEEENRKKGAGEINRAPAAKVGDGGKETVVTAAEEPPTEKPPTDTAPASTSATGSGGWIMAIAEEMGKIVDKQFENWEKSAVAVADLQVDALSEGKTGTTASRDLPSATIIMSAELQKFNMLMQSANSGIKTAGQSAAALAGRQ